MHWLWFHAGLSSPNSPWYLFWSGIGADWTRILQVGALIHFANALRQHHHSPALMRHPSEIPD